MKIKDSIIHHEQFHKQNLILLLIPILLSFYMRFGMADRFALYFHSFFISSQLLHFYQVFYEYLFVFIVLGLLPIFIILFGFKENLKSYGFQIGNLQLGFKIVFLSLFPIAVILLLTALLPDKTPPLFHSVYPAIPEVKQSMALFFLNSVFLLFYYFGFEIFYRGFILFGLKNKFGVVTAILIQTIPSVLIHFHKPNGELFASIVAEIAFGFLAIKTNSIFYGIFIHYFIGIGIELATILF